MRTAVRQAMRAAVRIARVSRDGDDDYPRPDGPPVAHSAGSNSYRVLIVGNGPALGIGVRSQDLALPGALARAISARTGAGVDVEVHAEPRFGPEAFSDMLRGCAGHRFDSIVVTRGGEEALDLLPAADWGDRLTAALAELRAFAGPSAEIVVTGIPAHSSTRGLPARLARVVAEHAAELDRVSFAVCAAWSGTSFVALTPAGAGARAAEQYGQWAHQIANEMVSHLPALIDDASDDVDEARRQSAVDRLGLSDSGSDPRLRRIVEMARRAFGAETALFTVLDRDLQLHVARAGIDAKPLPRSQSFCRFTILERDGMIVEDARNDERFRRNPRVLGEPHVRFYAGFPVNSPEGERVGALCVFDSSPRRRDEVNMSLLREFAHLLQDELWHHHAGATPQR